MEASELLPAIYIKNTRRLERRILFLGGGAFSLFGFIGIMSIIKGDPSFDWLGVVFLMCIPLATLAIDWLFRYFTPENYAVLHRDRMELPMIRGRYRVISWSDVKCIHWPKARASNNCLVLDISGEHRVLGRRLDMGPETISLADRITLVRYVRLAGANIPQEDWPEFCRRCAVLWLKWHQRGGEGGLFEIIGKDVPSEVLAIICRFQTFAGRVPFLAGIISPLMLPLFFALLASRRTWWTLAGMLAVATIIFGPLIWELNAGVVVAMIAIPLWPLLSGFLAPRHAPDDQAEVSGAMVGAGFMIFGFSLWMLAVMRGWLSPTTSEIAILVVFLTPIVPGLIAGNRQKRRLKDKEKAEEAEAQAYWAAYEANEAARDSRET